MPFRLRVQPEHPLEPLAEQGRFLLGLLHQRQQEKKEEAYRERQEERQEESDRRAAEAYELERAKTLAEAERAGYRFDPGKTTGGEIDPQKALPQQPLYEPRQTAQERLAEAIGDRIAPQLAEPERQFEVAEPGARFSPIQFGQGPQFQYDPELALEMYEQSPEAVVARREEMQERERLGRLADALEAQGQVPPLAGMAMREGMSDDPLVREVLEQQFGPTAGTRNFVSERDLWGSKIDALEQAINLVRVIASKDRGYGLGPPPLGEVIREVAQQFGLDKEELTGGYSSWYRTGRMPRETRERGVRQAGGEEGAGGEPPPPPPPVLDPTEVEEARKTVQGLDPDTARRILSAAYTAPQIDLILGTGS